MLLIIWNTFIIFVTICHIKVTTSPKWDESENGINTFQAMVQRDFIQEYPANYITYSKDHGHDIGKKGQDI